MAKAKKFGRVLFIGRFQPFHDGHLKVIKDLAGQSGKLMILIAGPEKPDAKNPFSFEEREKMTRLALAGEGVRNYEIARIIDVNDDEKWGRQIKKFGAFDIAYSRNPWTTRCLKKAGIPVKRHRFYERCKTCGREIRKRILNGRRWDSLVPPAVYRYVRKINGEKRIKNFAR